MSVYIWSDLHLNHRNIIKYCNRPFQDEKEMTEALLKSWRTVIKPKDTIINLGDVAWNISRKWMEGLIKELPGFKILILGNHDRDKSAKWWRDIGFDEASTYPILYQNFYLLSHEDLFMNDHMPYINIHGHVHQNSKENPQNVNVSVEVTDYIPINFQTIVDRFKPKEEEDGTEDSGENRNTREGL